MDLEDIPVEPEPRVSALNPTLENWLRKFGQPVAAGASNSAPSVRRLSTYGASGDGAAKRLNFDSPPLQAKQVCSAATSEHQELLSLRVECARLQTSNNKLSREKAEAELSSDREIRRLKSAIQELDSQVKHCHDHHETEIEQLSSRLDETKAARTQTQEECDALRHSCEQIQTQCNQLQAQLIQAEHERSSRTRRQSLEAADVEARCAAAEAHATHMHNELTELRAALEAANAHKNNLDVQRIQAEHKYKELRTEFDSWQLKHATLHKLNADVQQLDARTRENTALKQTIERLKQNAANATLLQEKLFSGEAKIERMQQAHTALEHENGALKLAVAEAGGTSSLAIDRLMHDKHTLTQQLQHANNRVSELLCGRPDSEQTELEKQLQQKNEEIDGLKERLNMKGDFDPAEMKVLHMQHNPLEEAHEEYSNEMQLLKKENAALSLRVKALDRYRRSTAPTPSSQSGDDVVQDEDDVTQQNDVATTAAAAGCDNSMMDVTAQVNRGMQGRQWQEKCDELTKQIDSLKAEREKSREIASEIARNYREMCTALTGYQFKLKDGNICQVESIFDKGAENEKSFFFQKSDSGEIQLLECTYANEWMDFMDAYLLQDHCIPAFLAAVTLQLAQRTNDEHNTTHGEDEDDECEDEMEDEDEEDEFSDEEEEELEQEQHQVQPFRMSQGRPPQQQPPQMHPDDPDTSGSDIVMLD